MCFVVLRPRGKWNYFLREAFTTSPITQETFFIGYEAVYEWESATAFKGELALELADIWGGIVIPRLKFDTDTKPGIKAAAIAKSIANSLANPRRVGQRRYKKWSDKLAKPR
jgi:hypothetical protein